MEFTPLLPQYMIMVSTMESKPQVQPHMALECSDEQLQNIIDAVPNCLLDLLPSSAKCDQRACEYGMQCGSSIRSSLADLLYSSTSHVFYDNNLLGDFSSHMGNSLLGSEQPDFGQKVCDMISALGNTHNYFDIILRIHRCVKLMQLNLAINQEQAKPTS